MPRTRAPWWMSVVAASYLALFGLLAYCELFGPQTTGLQADFGRNGMSLWHVSPGSPAEQAGLAEGDRVLAVDGRPIRHAFDWEMSRMNMEVGRALRLDIERGAQRASAELRPERRGLREWTSAAGASWMVIIGVRSASLAMALVVAHSRPNDLLARVGSLFLASLSTSGSPASAGFSAAWRQLPAPLGALIWIPAIANALFAPLLFTFSALLPRPLFRARRAWLLAWLPALLALPWIPATVYQLYRAQAPLELPPLLLPTALAVSLAYILGGLLALLLNYRRLADLNERRRVRLVLAGAAVGWLGPTPMAVALSVGSRSGLAGLFITPPAVILANLLYLAFPLSLAYAILRHRLFDVRVIVRQGLQYALARGVLTSLTPAAGAILFADVLFHGEQPLLTVLKARGWIYLALGGLAFAARRGRQRWLDALDRRFFRERYDAQRLLREVVEDVRGSASFAEVAPRAVAQVEAALHPQSAAILVRDPPEPDFRVLAGSLPGMPLAADAKIIGLLRVLGRPLEVSLREGGWLSEQLPAEEARRLSEARIQLLVPIAPGPAPTEALLALGDKRSEEPYAREDRDVLLAIATSLALLLDKSSPTTDEAASMMECPRCGRCSDAGEQRCARDGAKLEAVPLPRLLAGRYRLERRVGRGGMGTVYEAADTALARRVAVKLIREDLAWSAQASERFRREALAVAAFSHPNVVTLFDVGAVGSRPYLVMELLVGANLREELRREKRLGPTRALGILRGVTAAVEAAHQRGMVHRDLKPENVILARSDVGELVKILDFGLAKVLGTSGEGSQAETATRGLVGTLRYMPPEQLRGEQPHPAWDLWALAIMAYEMLTGAHPFAGGAPAAWQGAVLAGRFETVTVHLPAASPALEEFFAHAFALDRERRPAAAGAFFTALEGALR